MSTLSKEKLQRFIDLYYLNGKVNSVVWEFTDEGIRTNFFGQKKDVLGTIHYTGISIDDKHQDEELGVNDTKLLINMLSVLNDEIEIDVRNNQGENVNLLMNDEDSSIQYNLTDTEIISVPHKEDSYPSEWDVEINITKEVAEKFSRGVKALRAKDFAVKADDAVQLILGYGGSKYSNQVTINVNADKHNNIHVPTFSAKALDEILTVNNLAEDGITMYVHHDGLAYLSFERDEYSAEYIIPDLD